MQRAETSLAGRSFAVFGTGRLACAVTREFHRRGADTVDVALDDIAGLADAGVECLLAVGDAHDANVRAALLAGSLPVVVRAFDPELAEEVERRRPDGTFRVRAAYSVAHLAAPDFVAAALLGDQERNEVTLRLADHYVNVCRTTVHEPRRTWWPFGTRIAGRTPAQVFAGHHCHVLARRKGRKPWSPPGAKPLRAGEEILLGGRLHDVLDLARRQSRRERPRMRRPAPAERRRHPLQSARWGAGEAWTYATTRSMTFLFALFAVVSVAVAMAPTSGVTGKFQLWVATALGNTDGAEPQDELHAFVGGLGLLAGGIALGVGVSLMSAYFTERRLDDTMRRRVRSLRRHVVVVGLGDVGLRVAQLLDTLGVASVVLDPASASEQESRRRGRRLERSPVIARELESGLPAAGVDRALSVIATSEDNLLNVEACLRARRDGPHGIRTIARIFEDDEATRGVDAFGIDTRLTAAGRTAPAFVEAALQDESLRTFTADGYPMAALRWPSDHPVGTRQMTTWHEAGVRVLAVWRPSGGVTAPKSEIEGIGDRDAVMLAGPQDAIEGVLAELRRRTP